MLGQIVPIPTRQTNYGVTYIICIYTHVYLCLPWYIYIHTAVKNSDKTQRADFNVSGNLHVFYKIETGDRICLGITQETFLHRENPLTNKTVKHHSSASF